jgi:hypothetical protein
MMKTRNETMTTDQAYEVMQRLCNELDKDLLGTLKWATERDYRLEDHEREARDKIMDGMRQLLEKAQ